MAPALADLDRKLDRILKNQEALLKATRQIEQEERTELKEESALEAEERKIEQIESQELDELRRLEALEKEIKASVESHPLTKLTLKDLVRGAMGALIGIVLHYTFIYGVKAAENITLTRAIALYPIAYFVGLTFLYATGFRKVRKTVVLTFLPLRGTVLYLTALVVSILTLLFYFPDFGWDELAFKQIATVSLPAVIGACTADIIGKD